MLKLNGYDGVAYEGNYHPAEIALSGYKAAGWKHSTKTGTALSFNDTYNDTIEELSIQGKSEQNGTPSPNNPRPITGLQIGAARGNNLFDAETILNSGHPAVTRETYKGRDCLAFKYDEAAKQLIQLDDTKRHSYSGWFAITGDGYPDGYVDFLNKGGSLLDDRSLRSDGEFRSDSATLPAGTKYVWFKFPNYWDYPDAKVYLDINSFMLNEGTTPLPYEPFGVGVSDNPKKVTVRGKNLLDTEDLLSAPTPNYTKVRYGNGIEITEVYDAYYCEFALYIPVQPSTSYTLSMNKETVIAQAAYTSYETVLYCNAQKVYIGEKRSGDGASGIKTISFVTPDNCLYIKLRLGRIPAPLDGIFSKYRYTDIQLELGSTPTPYIPYRGSTDYPIPTPITLYSLPDGTADTVDFISGAGVRSVGVKVFDGTEAWALTSIIFYLTGIGAPAEYADVYCTHFPSGNSEGKCCTIFGLVRVYATAYFSTVADWKSYLAAQHAAGTPVTVLYKLATPQPVTVQPMKIQTIPRHTDISADGMEITATVKVVDTNL